MLLFAASAIVALALLSGVAAASRGIGTNVVEGENIIGTGRTTFEDGGAFGFRRIICEVTLTVKANRSLIVKATGGVIGEVTAGSAANCSDSLGNPANATVLAEATTNGARHPFPMSYTSFLGTLPEITGILVTTDRAAFLLEDPAARMPTCLYEGRQGYLFTIARRNVTRGTFLEGETASLVSGARECPTSGRLIGTQTFNRTITITLLN